MRRFVTANRATIAPVVALAVFVLAWEAIAATGRIPKFLLPSPSSVFGYTISHLGLFVPHAWGTIQSTLYGFILSVLFGIGLSMLIVWSRTFEDAVYPLVVMTQVIPKVAIAPLLIVYMGFGQEPKVFLAFLISFFPMVINTTLGMKSVNVELLMETTRPVTLVVPQTEKDEEEPDDPPAVLQAYAPMYTTLIDPPYELLP